MSKLLVSCVNNIFKGYDYNNLPIKYKLLNDLISTEYKSC